MAATVPSTQVDEIPATQVVPAEPVQFTTTCRRCQREVCIDDLAAEKHDSQSEAVCKPCHNLQVMIAKRFGTKAFNDLIDTDSQVQFFKDCLQKNGSGPLVFKNVRSCLKQSMRASVERTSKHGNQGSYQPLEYWVKLGYDGDRIKSKAPKQEHPVLGTTYAVDVVCYSDETLESMCEDKLLSLEQDVKKRKDPYAPKAAPKKRGKRALQGQPEAPAAPIDLTDEQKAEQKVLMDLTGMDSDSEKDVSWCHLSVAFSKRLGFFSRDHVSFPLAFQSAPGTKERYQP